MKDIDLKTLQLLVAVCDHQNIKHAAVEQHIEPSAISKRIAHLESVLGTLLLNRTRRGVHPTPAGLALLEHARTMLFTMDRIENDMAAFSGGLRGQVKVVASASAIAEALLDDVAAFMGEPANRNVNVNIEELPSRDIIGAIKDGRAAVGVCWDAVDFDNLEHLPYRQDQLALAVHEGHPLAACEALRFSETLDFDHVGMQPSSAVATMLQRAASTTGRSIRYRVIVSNFDAAFRVVAARLGVSVIPMQVGSTYPSRLGVKIIPLTDAWAVRRFAVCFRSRKSLQPAALRVVEYLSALSGASCP